MDRQVLLDRYWEGCWFRFPRTASEEMAALAEDLSLEFCWPMKHTGPVRIPGEISLSISEHSATRHRRRVQPQRSGTGLFLVVNNMPRQSAS